MKTRMTIGTKLYWSSAAAVLLMLLLGFTSLRAIGQLTSGTERVVVVNARKQFLAGDIHTSMADVLSFERGILHRSYMKDQAGIDKHNTSFQESIVNLKERLDQYTPLLETDKGRRMIQDIRDGVAQLQGAHARFYDLARSGDTEGAVQLEMSQIAPVASKAGEIAQELVSQENALMAAALESGEATASHNRWLTALAVALSLLVGAGVLLIVRQANSGLRRIARSLIDGATKVTSAASQVAASSQSLAQGSSEQAASLEETSAATEEISSMSRANEDHASSAAKFVDQTNLKFTETSRTLDEMVTAMTEISASSNKISSIIRIIDEISFQTNILALNAAVEAARAGEAGMGFAVVADEVRNLAQRSSQAAKDITTLIEDSIGRSNSGKTKVDQVAASIHSIGAETGNLKQQVDEVNEGSREQVRGLEQISHAVSQMEKVTQTTAASAEESAAAAQELDAQAAKLLEIGRRLTVMVGSEEK